MEGDGPLAFTCYHTLSTARSSIQVKHWPNTAALARGFATQQQQPALEQQLMAYALSCVQPGFDYIETTFFGELLPVVKAFKAAALFHPSKVPDISPDASAIEELKIFPFLCSAVRNLLGELPAYLAVAEGVSVDVDPLKWWEKQEPQLPHWANSCRKVLLCQPSSAAVERVFSTLKNSFNDQQSRALEDYVELSLMLQWNERCL